MFISKKSRKIIKYILKRGHITQYNIPYNFDRSRINDLISDNLIKEITLIPPGKEGYENGMYGYSVTPKGEDALKEIRVDQFKTNLSIILSVCAFILSVLIAFTPFPDWCKAWIDTISTL